MFWWIDKIVQNKSVQQLQRRSVIRLWVAAPPEYLLHVARTTDCSVKEARPRLQPSHFGPKWRRGMKWISLRHIITKIEEFVRFASNCPVSADFSFTTTLCCTSLQSQHHRASPTRYFEFEFEYHHHVFGIIWITCLLQSWSHCRNRRI